MKVCMIKAPGKAILCGEHAVVYGKDAIAMAIGLHCIGTLTKNNKKKENATITFQLQIQSKPFEIDADLLRKISEKGSIDFFENFQVFQQYWLQYFGYTPQKPYCYESIHQKLNIFLTKTQINWLQWVKNSKFDWNFKIQSQIPIGKCLGSSAAFNTVLATGMLIIFSCIAFSQAQSVKNETKEIINQLSLAFQSFEHGTPSGIDNFVSVHGGLILFNRSKSPKFRKLQISPQKFKNIMDVAVADSQIQKNTKTAVAMVRNRYETNQQDQDRIQRIGQISTKITELLEKGEINSIFFELIQSNHSILRQLELSHPEIEKLVQIGKIHGWTGKITGSGMGGCILFLAPSKTAKQNQLIRLAPLDKKGLTIQFYSNDQ